MTGGVADGAAWLGWQWIATPGQSSNGRRVHAAPAAGLLGAVRVRHPDAERYETRKKRRLEKLAAKLEVRTEDNLDSV